MCLTKGGQPSKTAFSRFYLNRYILAYQQDRFYSIKKVFCSKLKQKLFDVSQKLLLCM